MGTADGMDRDLKVLVMMEGNTIASVEVISHNDTSGVSGHALEEVPKEIVEAQSTEVDVVAGAIMTSRAIMETVENALN